MVVLRDISIQCAKISLGRWLGLAWTRGTEHAGETLRGWLARAPGPYSLHAPCCLGEGKCKKCYSPMPMTLEKVPAVSACLVDALGFINRFPSLGV